MNAALRPSRLLTAVTLAIAPAYATPAAAAVTPPPPDDSRLPAAAPPAPPTPTVQHEECTTPLSAQSSAPDPGQLADIDLSTVWALTRGAGQVVAVIDTGVARHRLLPHLVPGGDYVSTGDGTTDCDGHGTIIAGIIGAAPDTDGSPAAADTFSGIAPDATILGIRQSSNKFRAVDDPAESGFGDVDTLAAAVRAAADLGATVINISSVACVPADTGLDDRALGAALAYAVDIKSAVVVTAAGNVGGQSQCPGRNQPDRARWDNVNVVASPAWYDDYVLAVGSIGPDGVGSEFSLAGPWVDVAANGEGIVSLARTGDGVVSTMSEGSPISGTSYAAPVVSAIAALVRSRFPELTPRQVMQRIEETARHPSGGWNSTVGHGEVDALAAVSGPNTAGMGRASVPAVETSASAPLVENASGRTAFRGAGVCFALTAGIIVISTLARRLRRRDDAVPGD